MSHISVFKTKIVNPNPELVRQVMEALAQHLNAKLLVNQSYRDWYGNIHADHILVVEGRGIGVRVGEKLEIVGDPYGWENKFYSLRRQIIQNYVHFALLQQLQNMGYQLANAQMLKDGTIVGEVMRHG